MTFSEILEIAKLLLPGLWITVQLTLIGGALCIVVSVVVGAARLSRFALVRGLATAFVEFFRGTSAVVQLFWVFFALPLLGVSLSPMFAALIIFALNPGAYGAEVVRGAIQSVASGQREAAVALNMRPTTTMRRIILPQAVPAMIPPMTNVLVELLKGTALVSLVTINDLTFIGDTIRTRTGDSGTVFLVLFGIYFLLAACLTGGSRGLERVLAVRRGRRSGTGRRRRELVAQLEVDA